MPGTRPGAPSFGFSDEQVLDAVEDVQGDALCGGGVVLGDVGAQGEKIVNGFRETR